MSVAPLVGAWIEIFSWRFAYSSKKSLPSWERGLKYERQSNCCSALQVAPLVGAWIEIILRIEIVRIHNRRSPRGSVD